ncbi:MAG: DUF1850 domain-containing protein [Deltaproteobacteria bacterium]|nr:DUF1850 domain-containing protein [Deltaproteobacteria bacterium]MBW2046922.1 DUF1850 domain-containing protein [Deltaproteobacteria bacterium]MBW2110967.1 DUF1850 domain-containing protein [Deltaproteobacteria bacterium]
MGKLHKRRLILVIISLLFAAGAGLALYPRYILRITDETSHRDVLEIAAEPGDNVWIVFINSVEHLPVADHFVIDHRHELVFTETIYQAPYAGYLHPEKKELIALSTTRIPGIDRVMEEVTFFAGYEFKHLLFVNGNWTPLYHVAKGGDLIRITVDRKSMLTTLIDRILTHEQK